MKIISKIPSVDLLSEDGYDEINALWSEYRELLSREQSRIGRGAYAFAVASWHHDVNDYRGLHNANVVQVHCTLLPRAGKQVVVKLLNRAETHFIRITYSNVHAFEITFDRESEGFGNEDLLIDEIGLSENCKTTHCFVFASKKKWVVEFDDLDIRFEQVMQAQ